MEVVNYKVDVELAVPQMLEGRLRIHFILDKQRMVEYVGAGTEIGFSLFVFLQRSFQAVRTRTQLQCARRSGTMRRFGKKFAVLNFEGTERECRETSQTHPAQYTEVAQMSLFVKRPLGIISSAASQKDTYRKRLSIVYSG